MEFGRKIVVSLSRVCEAGQHRPCPAAESNDDDGAAWVCSCECHERKGLFEDEQE